MSQLGTTPTLEGMQFLDPTETVQALATLDSSTLFSALEPLAQRMSVDPELAHQFINQILSIVLENGGDLSPILKAILENYLGQLEIDEATLTNAINELAGNQQEVINIFKHLDYEVQRQLGGLFVYLQINRSISVDQYFTIARMLNLPKLPSEFWDILRFGVSNTSKMNTDMPANLEVRKPYIEA